MQETSEYAPGVNDAFTSHCSNTLLHPFGSYVHRLIQNNIDGKIVEVQNPDDSSKAKRSDSESSFVSIYLFSIFSTLNSVFSSL